MFGAIFNPFNAPRQDWRAWHPDSKDKCEIREGDMCLMLNRKTGYVYIKPVEKVIAAEMAHFAGHDMMIAYCLKKECFDPYTGKGV